MNVDDFFKDKILHFPGAAKRRSAEGIQCCLTGLKKDERLQTGDYSIVSVVTEDLVETGILGKFKDIYPNVNLELIVVQKEGWDNRKKITYFCEFLEKCKTKYCFLVDYNDVLFTGHPDDIFNNIIEKLDDDGIYYNGGVSSLGDHPNAKYFREKYSLQLNAGVCFGNTEKLLEFYSECREFHKSLPIMVRKRKRKEQPIIRRFARTKDYAHVDANNVFSCIIDKSTRRLFAKQFIQKSVSVTLVCADSKITNMNMFKEFLSYYSKLTYVFLIIDVKSKRSLRKMMRMMRKYKNVKYKLVEKCNYYDIVNKKYKNILSKEIENIGLKDGDWLVYADIDEFINYEREHVLEYLKEVPKNKMVVRGALRDLLTEDKTIPEYTTLKDTYSSYSLKKGAALGLGSYKKICATRYPKVCFNQAHHGMKGLKEEEMQEEILNVLHVRFMTETYDNLKNKESEKLNQAKSTKGRRRMRMIEKRNRKVLPFVEQGLIPDYFYTNTEKIDGDE